MKVWLGSMGLSIGGKTYKQVAEQARRISGCTLTFYADRAGARIESRSRFVKTAIGVLAKTATEARRFPCKESCRRREARWTTGKPLTRPQYCAELRR